MTTNSYGSKDYTKANLRLRKIHERSLKKVYTGFSQVEKKIIKNNIEWNKTIKELDFFWAHTAVYKNCSGQKVVDQKKTNWIFFYYLEKKREQVIKQQERLQFKGKLTDNDVDKILNIFQQINLHHCYSGSF